jgi:predicted dehydrogenase
MTIGLGIVGYGYWGPVLARNFLASPRFEVMAIAERRDALREKLSSQNLGPAIVGDLEDLLASPSIDAVVIATPVGTHFELARRALIARKHVLVEKPMCTSVAEAEELCALAKRVDRVLMVDHTFLFTGAVQAIRKLVKDQELGRLCYYDSMRVNLGMFQPDVNVLWDLAPHDLSIIHALFPGKVVAMDASGYGHINPNIPDMAYMTLHFDDDAVAHLNMSWMAPAKVRRIALGGTKKMLIWDDLNPDERIKIYDTGIEYQANENRTAIVPDYRIGNILSPHIPKREAMAGVVEHFGRVIAGEEPSIMSGADGLRIVRVLAEAQEQLNRRLSEIAGLRSGAAQ